jgi:hypothetical protein
MSEHAVEVFSGTTLHQPDLLARFIPKVKFSDSCWTWLAATDNHGYGVISVSGRLRKAHRVAHEMSIGAIPAGMLIDHTCHNRGCVNPDHLQVVTSMGNVENRGGANRNNKSCGIRGVSWSRRRRKWVVLVGHDRRRYYGGMFECIDQAEAAAVALRHPHGEQPS